MQRKNMKEEEKATKNLIRTSIPEEYDFPKGIGAFPAGLWITEVHRS